MRNLLLSLLSILLMLPCSAQTSSDSLAVKSNFKAGELIMPLSLIAAGTLGFVEPIRNSRYEVRDYLNEWRGDHRTEVDDYLQYVPLASIYGLSLLGAEAKHNYVDRTLELATSYLALGAIVNGIKYTVREPRPDGSSNNSFPSGHTATTFMGAELVRIEYGEEHPWLAVGAYTIATTVGVLRVYNERHWFTDVFAGAGVGILSARIGYWLLPYTKRMMHRLTGCEIFVSPTASSTGAALNTVIRF
ncbi:MAG: phosphatase PAP2 family protein [Bacteroidaceae bacterium]|nr:phosphatase PAP2 family protein [Bacteroidaceae bacterium]